MPAVYGNLIVQGNAQGSSFTVKSGDENSKVELENLPYNQLPTASQVVAYVNMNTRLPYFEEKQVTFYSSSGVSYVVHFHIMGFSQMIAISTNDAKITHNFRDGPLVTKDTPFVPGHNMVVRIPIFMRAREAGVDVDIPAFFVIHHAGNAEIVTNLPANSRSPSPQVSVVNDGDGELQDASATTSVKGVVVTDNKPSLYEYVIINIQGTYIFPRTPTNSNPQ